MFGTQRGCAGHCLGVGTTKMAFKTFIHTLIPFIQGTVLQLYIGLDKT